MCVYRMLVGMMMYEQDSGVIAKPSELLNSVASVMSVLQSLENYSQLLCCDLSNASY